MATDSIPGHIELSDDAKPTVSLSSLDLQDHNEARSADQSDDASTKLLPLWFKMLYGSPRLSMLSLTFLIQVHSVLMYEFAGAPLAYIAFFTALGRSFDTLTDPLMGWITDSTRTKWGRRRPYMVLGSVGYAISFVLFMSPPSFLSPIGTALWFGLFYVVFYTFDTLTNVPYVALGPELTDDYDDRSSVFFWAKVFDSIGIVVAVLGPSLFRVIVGDTWQYTALSVFLGIYYVTSMLTLSYTVRERNQATLASQPPFIPSVLKSISSKPFRPLLFGWILDFCALSTLSSMLPFFITYIVRPQFPGRVLGIAIGSVFGAGIVSMPMFLWASKRYGRYKTWCWFNLLNGITCACFAFVGEGDIAAVIIVAILNGVPIGGNFLVDSILTDVIDYDEFLHGTRSEGAFTVFAQIIPKVVSIPAQTLPLAMLGVCGFIPSVDGVAQEQPQQVLTFIRVVFVGVPTFCTLTSYVIKLTFPIKNKETATKVTLGIIAHQDGRGFEDPLTGQWVLPHTLSEEETAQAWVLNSFQTSHLYRLLKSDTPKGLVFTMKKQLFISSASVTVFSVILVNTFGYLKVAEWAWVPSFVILVVGVSFSFTVFAIMRLKAAYKVSNTMVPLPHSTLRALVEIDYPSAADGPSQSDDESRSDQQLLEKNGSRRATTATQDGQEPGSLKPKILKQNVSSKEVNQTTDMVSSTARNAEAGEASKPPP